MSMDCEDVRVIRPALTVEQRWQQYSYTKSSENGLKALLTSKAHTCCQCSRKCFWKWLRLRIPILSWLPNYPLRSALLGDVIAGTTVAIMHIPQGMAYALLANLPPITGLYMALFPVLIYVILGTSRHVSMGTFAIACLMMGKVVNELSNVPSSSGSATSNITMDKDHDNISYTGQQIAAVLALMVGIWEVLLGLLQMGALLNVFLSDMLISGFTTGVAVHVLTSQIKYLFGIPVTAYSGPLKLIYIYIDVFRKIFDANPGEMLISAFCISLLVFNNEMKPKVKKYTNIPIPIELMVVILGTAASYYGQLHEVYGIRIVGHISTGLPAPSSPPVELLPRVALDAFIIGIVGYTSTFSVAKIFAKRRGYAVDATQELYAQGLSNVFGSFFSCGPMAASLSRSLIQEAVGGFTLLTTFISCCFIVLILLFVGPLFETVPNCVLSSIIVVALKGLLRQSSDMLHLWSISRVDALIWIATFGSTIIIDLDYGLLVGVIVSMLVLLARTQRPSTCVLGHIPDTDLYLDIAKYPHAVQSPGIRIFQFGGSLHFANVSYFREELLSKTGLASIFSLKGKRTAENAQKMKNADSKEENHIDSTPLSHDNPVHVIDEGDGIIDTYECITVDREEARMEKESTKVSDDITQEDIKNDKDHCKSLHSFHNQDVKWVIIDMGTTSFVDSTGAKQLLQLHKELMEMDIMLCIAGAADTVLENLEQCGSVECMGGECFYHSIHDAMTIIRRKTVSPSSSSYTLM